MDQRNIGGRSEGATPTTSSYEEVSAQKPRGFSENAKKTMVNMLEEMIETVQPDGYIRAWPSFESMVMLHEQISSGLVEDPEVGEYAQALFNKLRLQTSNPRIKEQCGFLELHFWIDDPELN